jgi:general stress protein 26
MTDMTITDIAKAMKHIDITILSTITTGGAVTGRPMSNNRDVDYDGDSYFFTDGSAQLVKDIEANPNVGLGLQGKHHLWIAISGKADLIRDKAAFQDHWNKDLEKWFAQGVDTPGLVLVHAKAERIEYWDGKDSGVVKL